MELTTEQKLNDIANFLGEKIKQLEELNKSFTRGDSCVCEVFNVWGHSARIDISRDCKYHGHLIDYGDGK